MKICVVCSGNFGKEMPDVSQSAVYEQVMGLEDLGYDIHFFLIKGKGVKGYLKNRKPLREFIKKENFDFIHAHYGLSALLVSISTRKPFIVTFHGSDVNKVIEHFLSLLPGLLSRKNIFVSKKLQNKFLFGFFRTLKHLEQLIQLRSHDNLRTAILASSFYCFVVINRHIFTAAARLNL